MITLDLISATTTDRPCLVSLSKVRTALGNDPLAYALFCQKNNIEYETQDPYLILAQQYYREGAPKFLGSEIWVDRSLDALAMIPSLSSFSLQQFDALCDAAQESLLRPVVLRPKEIQRLRNSSELLGSDCFYHDFYESFTHIPLMDWVQKEYHQTFDKALKYQANPHLSPQWMIVALLKGCVPIVKALLEAGFPLNWQGPNQESLLSYALQGKEFSVIHLLLSYGVAVDRKDIVLALDLELEDCAVELLNYRAEKADRSLLNEILLQCSSKLLESLLSRHQGPVLRGR